MVLLLQIASKSNMIYIFPHKIGNFPLDISLLLVFAVLNARAHAHVTFITYFARARSTHFYSFPFQTSNTSWDFTHFHYTAKHFISFRFVSI